MPLPQDWMRSPAAATAGEEIRRELERDFGGAPLFVVKDPRLTRLLPLWLAVLDGLRTEPIVVIPFRNPLEVARSLARREGFPLSKALLLYSVANLEAEFASRGHRRLFVEFSDILHDWRRFADRLREAVGEGVKAPDPAIASEIEAFLADDLHRERAAREDLTRSSEGSGLPLAIYERLIVAAEGEGGEASFADFDLWRTLLLQGAAFLRTDSRNRKATPPALSGESMAPVERALGYVVGLVSAVAADVAGRSVEAADKRAGEIAAQLGTRLETAENALAEFRRAATAAQPATIKGTAPGGWWRRWRG